MTDPTPASDALVAELREAHAPGTAWTREGTGESGHYCASCWRSWPCPTSQFVARLDEVEADREHWRWAAERHMARASQMAQATKRAEADRDRWKARAEEAVNDGT